MTYYAIISEREDDEMIEMKEANDRINIRILFIIGVTEFLLYKFSVAKAYRRNIYQTYSQLETYPWRPGHARKVELEAKDDDKYQ